MDSFDLRLIKGFLIIAGIAMLVASLVVLLWEAQHDLSKVVGVKIPNYSPYNAGLIGGLFGGEVAAIVLSAAIKTKTKGDH